MLVCRICHCEGDDECPLITPCRCTGSLSFVHQACLNQWIKSSDTRCCELCKYDFIMETKLKPLNKVRSGSPPSCREKHHIRMFSFPVKPFFHLLCLLVGEAAHVEEREEEDLLFGVVPPDRHRVYVVVRLHPGEENHRRDPTWEERSVLFSLVSGKHIPEPCRVNP